MKQRPVDSWLYGPGAIITWWHSAEGYLNFLVQFKGFRAFVRKSQIDIS